MSFIQPVNAPALSSSDFVLAQAVRVLAASPRVAHQSTNPPDVVISDASNFQFYGLPYETFSRNAAANSNDDEGDRIDEGSSTHL